MIPTVVSKVVFASDQPVYVNGGSGTIPASRWYYGISNRSSADNGQSLLYALQAILAANTAGAVTVTLTADMRVMISASITAVNITLLPFYFELGFAVGAFVVNPGAPVIAPNRPRWLWSPDMPVSSTGPVLFDPAFQVGIASRAGASQRSSDGTTAFTSGEVTVDAEYVFMATIGQENIYPKPGYTNRDLHGFWRYMTDADRCRLLWWRDRDQLVGSAAPQPGSSVPYRCIEYVPQEALRKQMQATPSTPNGLVHWDVRFPLWLTEAGETPMSS